MTRTRYVIFTYALSFELPQCEQSRDKNILLCTSIRTEPVSKSAISFLKMDKISWSKVHIPWNGTL